MSDKSDPTDAATIREEIEREEAMAYRKPIAQAFGWCNFCSEPVASGVQFCDAECRDGWQWVMECKERNHD